MSTLYSPTIYSSIFQSFIISRKRVFRNDGRRKKERNPIPVWSCWDTKKIYSTRFIHQESLPPSLLSLPPFFFLCTMLVKRRASSKIVLRDTRFLSWMPRFEDNGRDERERTWESIALIRRGHDIYIWDIEVNLKIFWRDLVSKEISLNNSC